MEKIILFGTGKYFNTKRNILNTYEVKRIIDNKVSDRETKLFESTGIEMVNPNKAGDGEEKIFLMSMYFVSMWEQLMKSGINPQRLVYPYFVKPYFQSDSVVDECVTSIEFGEKEIVVNCKNGDTYTAKSQKEWNEVLRGIYRSKYGIISAIAGMGDEPVSEQFATERGTPVDRYYIDKFLNEYSHYICGDVLEIEDNTYTKKYGGEKVGTSIVMDVSSKASNIDFNANIETGEGIKASIADCFICTQTLMYIYDLKSAARNICKLLKPGGAALITCSGLSQNSRRCMESYGAYWGFNEAVFQKMFSDESEMELVITGAYGNVKTVTAHISGLCVEDLQEADFEKTDVCYPLIVYAVVKKNG